MFNFFLEIALLATDYGVDAYSDSPQINDINNVTHRSRFFLNLHSTKLLGFRLKIDSQNGQITVGKACSWFVDRAVPFYSNTILSHVDGMKSILFEATQRQISWFLC